MTNAVFLGHEAGLEEDSKKCQSEREILQVGLLSEGDSGSGADLLSHEGVEDVVPAVMLQELLCPVCLQSFSLLLSL